MLSVFTLIFDQAKSILMVYFSKKNRIMEINISLNAISMKQLFDMTSIVVAKIMIKLFEFVDWKTSSNTSAIISSSDRKRMPMDEFLINCSLAYGAEPREIDDLFRKVNCLHMRTYMAFKTEKPSVGVWRLVEFNAHFFTFRVRIV